MNVDVESLETFTRLAHEGAEHAAAALGTLSGVEPAVRATSVDLVPRSDVGEALDEREFVGVRVAFEGSLRGTTVLVLDRESVATLLAGLPDPGGADEQARIEEVGNVLLCGFLDGWADHLDASIDVTPPTYLEGIGAEVFPADPSGTDRDQVFAFTSRLESDAGATARLAMFPAHDSVATLMGGRTADAVPIPLDKLAVFNRMAEHGARDAADAMTTMTGLETDVEVSQLRFVPVERVPDQVDDRPYVGTAVRLEGRPDGYLLVLFDEASARSLVGELVPAPPDGAFDDLHRSAIEEVGNIMTSGFVDGWANVLGTGIRHSPPQFVHDMGGAIVDGIAAEIGRDVDHAFVIDSGIECADRAIACEIYTFPDGRALRRALNELSFDPEEDEGETLRGAMEANYDDL